MIIDEIRARPRALDLFCGEGGASMGLHMAGYEVTGVDIKSHKYPFGHIVGVDLSLPGPWMDLQKYDLIWASPPCQRYVTGGLVKNRHERPDLIAHVREVLKRSGVPFVIENVPAAPLRADITLCGSHFGLPIRRHRIFETSWRDEREPMKCDHSRPVIGVYGNPHGKRGAWPGMLPGTIESWRAAMGAPWMTARGLSQAIPPVYAKYVVEGLR